MSVGLFTTPRPFKPPFDVIQTNALKSWTLLDPKPAKIMAFCDREFEGDLAVDTITGMGIQVSGVRQRSERGVPFVGDLFTSALCLGDIPCYVNADIIMQNDVLNALSILDKRFDSFLAIAGRWNVQLLDLLEFSDGWKDRLWKKVQEQGSRSPEIAVDLFAWKGNLYPVIPDFRIGRYKWDNWLVGHALSQHIPVIDISPAVRLIHQVHACVPWEDPDATVNHAIEGPTSGLKGATHTLTLDGILNGWHGGK